jgi:hypothetical protein
MVDEASVSPGLTFEELVRETVDDSNLFDVEVESQPPPLPLPLPLPPPQVSDCIARKNGC